MKKKLDNKEIVTVLKEEWYVRKAQLLSELKKSDLSLNVKDAAPGLKVKHESSGSEYTVDAVGPRGVSLLNAEGEKVFVTADIFNKEYKLS